MISVEKMILTAGPSIGRKEISYCADAAENGWNESHSHYLKKFEQKFQSYVGANHAVPTSSCTGAMHLALLALGIKPGDEVIVPEITWIATAAAVKYVGAVPVFCDVDKESWTMCPKSVEQEITSKTKAIMPVHIYGHPCEMDPIWDLAKQNDLYVIEDAAQSIGSEYKGQKTGSLGDMAAFSFQGAKALVTGEGGMLLCKNSEFFEKVKFLGDHGRDPNKVLFNTAIGYKYKMSNIQAALGLAQIERVEEIVARKREIFSWYKSRLENIPEISLNVEKSWAKNIYWMSSIILSDKLDISRDVFMRKLKERNIDSRPIFYPISTFPMFESKFDANSNAYLIGNRGINLPSGHNRTEEEIDYICTHIKDILGYKTNNFALKGWLNYRKNTSEVISGIKATDKAADLINISDGEKKLGYLQPITKDVVSQDDNVQLISQWRDQSQEWFPSQFKVTVSGTKKWLETDLLQKHDRILYFVCNCDGEKIGHVGLNRFDYHERTCELDNIIRGVGAHKGIMQKACQALLQDAIKRYDLKTIYLKVFSDNYKAIGLYEKLGFVEIQRVPLVKNVLKDSVNWDNYLGTDYTRIDRYFVTMAKDL